MDHRTASDEVLIKAIEQRDLQALEELYDRHHTLALTIAYRVLEDRGLAEDVVQETFLAAWRQAGSFKPELGSARSWLLSIVRHRAIDVTRGGAFSKESFSLDRHPIEPNYSDVWQEVSRKLDKRRIREAVEELPPDQKEAIMLAFFKGYTYKEIAERMGVPLGTVKGRIRLAMQKLRTLLVDVREGESR